MLEESKRRPPPSSATAQAALHEQRFPSRPTQTDASWAETFADHWEAADRQVQVGLYQVKKMVSMLRKACEVDEEYSRLMSTMVHNETIKYSDKLKDDHMDMAVAVWQQAKHAITEVAVEKSKFAGRIRTEVIEPLNAFHSEKGALRKGLLSQHKAALGEYETVRTNVLRSSAQYHRLLTIARGGVPEADVATAITEATSAKPGHQHHPSTFDKMKSLKAKVAKSLRALVPQSPADALDKLTPLATQLPDEMRAANKRQEQYYQADLPTFLKTLQEIEHGRLAVVKQALERYSQLSTDALTPVKDISVGMTSSLRELDPHKELTLFTQQGYEQFGPAHPVVPFSTNLPVSAADLKAGRLDPKPDSLFHTTIQRVMELTLKTDPSATVPKILTVLVEAIKQFGGFTSEGIFRISADKSHLDKLHAQFDTGNYDVPKTSSGPHLPASLLKEWLRELEEPLVPMASYARAIDLAHDNEAPPAAFLSLFNGLDPVTKNVIRALALMCSDVSSPENSEINKMTLDNLAIVFAPSFLRNPSDDPVSLLMNTKFESKFTVLFLAAVVDADVPVSPVPSASAAAAAPPTPTPTNSGGGGGGPRPPPPSGPSPREQALAAAAAAGASSPPASTPLSSASAPVFSSFLSASPTVSDQPQVRLSVFERSKDRFRPTFAPPPRTMPPPGTSSGSSSTTVPPAKIIRQISTPLSELSEDGRGGGGGGGSAKMPPPRVAPPPKRNSIRPATPPAGPSALLPSSPLSASSPLSPGSARPAPRRASAMAEVKVSASSSDEEVAAVAASLAKDLGQAGRMSVSKLKAINESWKSQTADIPTDDDAGGKKPTLSHVMFKGHSRPRRSSAGDITKLNQARTVVKSQPLVLEPKRVANPLKGGAKPAAKPGSTVATVTKDLADPPIARVPSGSSSSSSSSSQHGPDTDISSAKPFNRPTMPAGVTVLSRPTSAGVPSATGPSKPAATPAESAPARALSAKRGSGPPPSIMPPASLLKKP